VSRTYFTDRDLGKQFPRILADAGIPVQRHGDIFAPDGTDEQWLEHCGTQRLVAITHNSRIRYVPNELAALQRCNVALVVVVGKAPTAELARNFVSTLNRIEAMLDQRAAPLILKIYRPTPSELERAPDAPGRVEVWFPKPDA
jgi:hypothetical protein